jgi:hypothetical protein
MRAACPSETARQDPGNKSGRNLRPMITVFDLPGADEQGDEGRRWDPWLYSFWPACCMQRDDLDAEHVCVARQRGLEMQLLGMTPEEPQGLMARTFVRCGLR